MFNCGAKADRLAPYLANHAVSHQNQRALARQSLDLPTLDWAGTSGMTGA